MERAHTLTFGPFRLDTTSGRLWRQDDVVPLRPRSLAMLQYLAERPGRLVTKAELLQQVWDGAHVSDDVLRASVRDIRRALGDAADAPQYLETVGGQGYRFLQGGDALSLQAAGPVVGRQGDVDQLKERFGRAAGGERQFVLLSGEPGIGKTTVVELFLARMAEREGVRVGQGQCVVHYGDGEAYRPLLEALGRLGRGPDGSEVIRVLQRFAPMWLVQLPALVGGADIERLQRQVQGATRARMVRELSEALEVLTTETPLILVLEDLHWSDVSTVELLATIAQRPEPARLLVLGTYRPADAAVHAQALRDVVQELRGRGQCDEMSMEFLGAEDVTAYVAGRLGGAVSAVLARVIYERTEGNPLFMVNLIDHLVHQGALVQQDGQWTVREEAKDTVTMVPEGLRSLLTLRLEALSPAERRVLEVASVAGTDYATATVAAGLQQGVDDVEALSESLATQGHFIAASGLAQWPDGTLSGRYRFQHALYHQVLYEQVGAARRVQLHRRLGERLEVGYGEGAHEMAAALAVHFEQGHDAGRAVQYRRLAGEQALSRHAYLEATQHLSRGLEWLRRLPETLERVQHELALLSALGPALVATQGYAAPEVEQTYTRARDLCQRMGDTDQLFPMLRGLSVFYYLRADHQTARELGEQCLVVAQQVQDDASRQEAHTGLGFCLLCVGDYMGSQQHVEQALALANPRQSSALHGSFAVRDATVACYSFLGVALGGLGFAEQAVQRSVEAVIRGRDLAHAYSLALGLFMVATLHQFRRDGHRVQACAEELCEIATQQGFPMLRDIGIVFQGWALAVQGQPADGLALIQQGRLALKATGVGLFQSYFLALQAEVVAQMGQMDVGLQVLTEALAVVEVTTERFYEAELYRLQGELLLGQNDPNEADAETCFSQALDIAHRQQAKAWELRAAMSLSRLWQQQDKRQDAYDLLAPVYEWFTEGFDTTDLREAKALFDTLRE
ncbi:MAG: AAA family ATPase [Candidatus Tectomicrobia bacterium]